MPVIDIAQAKADAVVALAEEQHKERVKFEVERLRNRKAHLFPKRLRFQWPVRFEHWYKPEVK